MNTPKTIQKAIRDNLLAKSVENTEDWWSDEIKRSNMEWLAWLEKQVK